MSENIPRRSMRLADEAEKVEAACWQIMDAAGQIRKPLTLSAIRSLVDVGIVNADTKIAPIENNVWLRLSDRPLWPEVRPIAAKLTLQGFPSIRQSPAGPQTDIHRTVAPRMQQAIEAKERAEINQLIAYWRRKRFASFIRAAREIFIFLLFVTAGDFLSSWIDPSQGVAKWMVALGVLIVALGYYIFQAVVF